jgi:hypothetical protein
VEEDMTCPYCENEYTDDPRTHCECEEHFCCNCCGEEMPDSDGHWYDGSFFCPDCMAEYLKDENEIAGTLSPVLPITQFFNSLQNQFSL